MINKLVKSTKLNKISRISNKKPVVAKVSPNSLRLEREYYIMKRLYQLGDGPSFLGKIIKVIFLYIF
jgi:hypothetical protein